MTTPTHRLVALVVSGGLALVLSSWGRAAPLVDTDILTLIACKPEGHRWLCGAYENQQLQTFYSEYNITKVEFKGEMADPAAGDSQKGALYNGSSAPANGGEETEVQPAKQPPAQQMETLPSMNVGPRYTLQLMACKSDLCRRRMEQMKSIPGSYVVAIKQEGTLWDILITGGYPTIKEAQQHAGELMLRYRLQQKPWVRSLQSLYARRVVR